MLFTLTCNEFIMLKEYLKFLNFQWKYGVFPIKNVCKKKRVQRDPETEFENC